MPNVDGLLIARALKGSRLWVLLGTLVIALGASTAERGRIANGEQSTLRYLDGRNGRDWPGYGRSYGEQHYSPLIQINETNIGRLSLAWSMDLGPQNSATEPVAVDGVLYFATGLSVVHAVDAVSGKLLWKYDPEAAIRLAPTFVTDVAFA